MKALLTRRRSRYNPTRLELHQSKAETRIQSDDNLLSPFKIWICASGRPRDFALRCTGYHRYIQPVAPKRSDHPYAVVVDVRLLGERADLFWQILELAGAFEKEIYMDSKLRHFDQEAFHSILQAWADKGWRLQIRPGGYPSTWDRA